MEQPTYGGVLPAGTPSPSFSLRVSPGEVLSSAQLRGRPVALIIYPADWSPVCGDQLAAFESELEQFRRLGATLLGLSVDGPWSHRAYVEARGLHFPLLSDFEPKGAVCRSFGAYDYKEGVGERALYVLDGEGIIQWSHLAPKDVNPGAEDMLAAIAALRAKT